MCLCSATTAKDIDSSKAQPRFFALPTPADTQGHRTMVGKNRSLCTKFEQCANARSSHTPQRPKTPALPNTLQTTAILAVAPYPSCNHSANPDRYFFRRHSARGDRAKTHSQLLLDPRSAVLPVESMPLLVLHPAVPLAPQMPAVPHTRYR